MSLSMAVAHGVRLGSRRRQMGSVFISHVEADRELAIEIATCLEAAGFRTWYYERDSDPGPSYLIQVHHAIEKCAAVVLLISPNSIRSHQMTKEVVRANDLGKPFIPVLSNISHAEFQERQPEWSIAIGAAASIPVSPTDVSGIMPRIVRGIAALQSDDADEAVRHENRRECQTSPVSSTLPAPVPSVETHVPPEAVKRSRQIAAALAAVVVLGGTYFFVSWKSPASEWMTSQQYQQAFDRHLQEGFYPDKVEGRCVSDSEQFRVEWKGIPLGAAFFSHHAITKVKTCRFWATVSHSAPVS